MALVEGTPGYWMNETTGVLRPAVLAYLNHLPMTAMQIAALRAYLRQWIEAPAWAPCPDLDTLRHDVDGLTTLPALRQWIATAEQLGIDPL